MRARFGEFRPALSRAEGEVVATADADGRESFPIAGVFYNYTNDQGLVFLSAKNFRALWHDDRVNSVAVYLTPDASAEALGEGFPRAI